MNIFWKGLDTLGGIIGAAAERMLSIPSVQPVAEELAKVKLRQSLQEFISYQEQILQELGNLNSIEELEATYALYRDTAAMMEAKIEEMVESDAVVLLSPELRPLVHQSEQLHQPILAAKTNIVFQSHLQDQIQTLEGIKKASSNTSRIYEIYHARHIVAMARLNSSNEYGLSREMQTNVQKLDQSIKKVSDLKNRGNKRGFILSKFGAFFKPIKKPSKNLNNAIQAANAEALNILNNETSQLFARINSAATRRLLNDNIEDLREPAIEYAPPPAPADEPPLDDEKSAATVRVLKKVDWKPEQEHVEALGKMLELAAQGKGVILANIGNFESHYNKTSNIPVLAWLSIAARNPDMQQNLQTILTGNTRQHFLGKVLPKLKAEYWPTGGFASGKSVLTHQIRHALPEDISENVHLAAVNMFMGTSDGAEIIDIFANTTSIREAAAAEARANNPAAEEQKQVREVREQVAAATAPASLIDLDNAIKKVIKTDKPNAAQAVTAALAKADADLVFPAKNRFTDWTLNHVLAFNRIVYATANRGSLELAGMRTELEAIKKDVVPDVHPLTFLAMVAHHPQQKKDVTTIYKKWVVDPVRIGFMNYFVGNPPGIGAQLKLAHEQDKNVEGWINDFAAAINVPVDQIRPCFAQAAQNNWKQVAEELVKFITKL